MKILNTLLGLVRDSKNKDKSKDDVLLVTTTDSDTKFEIEKSQVYLGYKMFWIIKMFIDGKSFPQGTLSPEKHRQHVYDIVNFIMIENFLIEMVDFDAEQFFRVIGRIFQGQPLRYLKSQKEWYQRNSIKGGHICVDPEVVIEQLY